jgi:hypothetical protein
MPTSGVNRLALSNLEKKKGKRKGPEKDLSSKLATAFNVSKKK